MSYEDYRTGGAQSRRQSAPDPSAYDSFAARASSTATSSPPPVATPASAPGATLTPSRPAPAVASAPIPASSTVMNGITTSSFRVDNPYASNAYASSRVSTSTVGGGASYGAVPGMGGAVASPDSFYMGSKPKGNRQGKLKDTIKNTMAAAKQDNWKVVCVKATNHDVAAPKGKHVRVIMQGLHWRGSITNRESPAGGIFYHLRKRMMLNEWIVVAKSQTIFHHIFRDGDEKFVEYVAANARGIFKMEFFGDASSEGIAYAGFIKTYGAYIEQWLAMKAAIRFPPGKSRDDDPTISSTYREAAIEDLLAALPLMMDTLDKLFGIELTGQIKFSPVAAPAFSMILRDLTLIWVALSEGMIRLLDLYFSLEIPKATIALDIYKRFVDIVARAQPFFRVARSINERWQTPELGAISLELIESMTQYLSLGPQDNTPQEPTFSDEEQYEPEPEPEPDHYYEPEPEYYSEEEPEMPPEPRRPPTPPTPSESSASSSSSEEESSSSEEEEPQVLPTAPPPPPQPKKFDPLADLLGITSGVGNGISAGQPQQQQQPQQTMALQVYGANNPALLQQRATLEHTVDDRVANIKGLMAANGHGQQQAQQPRSGFGVDGTNMQVALYGQQQPQQQFAQNQQQMLMQQQMAAYQTMAAYQSMAMYQQMQQQSMAGGMNPAMQGMQTGMPGMQRMQMMPGAAYMPTPQGNTAVPAMQAERNKVQAANYRVQRSTKPTRVNDDDQAFGPLLDQMKKASLGK